MRKDRRRKAAKTREEIDEIQRKIAATKETKRIAREQGPRSCDCGADITGLKYALASGTTYIPDFCEKCQQQRFETLLKGCFAVPLPSRQEIAEEDRKMVKPILRRWRKKHAIARRDAPWNEAKRTIAAIEKITKEKAGE